MSSLDSTIITIPERVTGKLPIAYWDIYFNILIKRLAQEFPESDYTERTNVALGNLQIIACGNAALDSLAQFRKVIQKRGDTSEGSVQKRASKGKRVKAILNRIRRTVFDF